VAAREIETRLRILRIGHGKAFLDRERLLKTLDRAGIILRGHLSGAKLFVAPSYFAPGATIIRVACGE